MATNRKGHLKVTEKVTIKRAREIRKFHVVVAQRQQRNVQNSVIAGAKLLFVIYKHFLFAVFLSVTIVVGFVVIQK